MADTERGALNEARLKARQWLVDYYCQPTPPGPDADYDALVQQVRELEARHPNWRDWDAQDVRVQPQPQDPFPERRHSVPMLSLANVYSLEELREWDQGVRKLLPEADPSYVAELKIDGVAVSLEYTAGELTAAVTRGDGAVGEDVTRNMKTIGRVPHRLSQPVHLQVRGEVFYRLSAFAGVNEARVAQGEAPFKNPRNATAGTLRMIDSTTVSQRPLDLFVYGLASPGEQGTHWDVLQWLESLGLPVNETAARCADIGEVEAYHARWMQARDTLDYQIDGVVVKVDQLDLREHLGFTAKSPRWAAAFKFTAEQARTVLRRVEIGVGRTGTLTPIANLDPVELGGTTVSRATLHNYDQIGRLDLHVGDTVYLEKGGDIIPKVVGVDLDAREGAAIEAIAPPAACPSCGTEPVRVEGEVDYHCPNPACPAQQTERLLHFVSRKGMDIESLGPALIEQLLQRDLVATYVDLYALGQEDLIGLERMGEKSSQNVVAAIDASRKRPLEKFLFALGIRHVGERTAQVLARHFGSLERLRAASAEELEDLNDIGAVIARSVHQFLQDEHNWQLIQAARELGVDPEPPEPVGGEGAAELAGRTVVITGALSEPRGRWKQRLERAGATVTSSVSKRTDFLLVGESPGSKLAAAERYGVRVVNEAQMAELLEGP